MLERAGFAEVKVYGGFEGEPFTTNTRRARDRRDPGD